MTDMEEIIDNKTAEEAGINPEGGSRSGVIEEWANRKVAGKFSWGVLILAAGCIWALIMLIRSILFFFN